MRNVAARKRWGFTLAELIVAMSILSVIGLVMVSLYDQALVTFRHASSKMEMQQHARETAKRLVPIIASGAPTGSDDAILEPAVGAPGVQMRIYTTESFARRLTGGTPVTFDPRSPDFARLRLWWMLDPNVNQADPQRAPGGQSGMLMLDPDTPGDPSDDRVLGRNIYSVEFENQGNHRTHVEVNIYGFVRLSNRSELRRFRYENVIHMPYYTQPGGGG